MLHPGPEQCFLLALHYRVCAWAFGKTHVTPIAMMQNSFAIVSHAIYQIAVSSSQKHKYHTK